MRKFGKNKEKCGPLINIFILAIAMVYWRNNNDLDNLWKKRLRYEHHQLNFGISLRDDIIPDGLRITKVPGIAPVTSAFDDKWQSILHQAEIQLVTLLAEETTHVITGLQKKFEDNLNEAHNNGNEGRLKTDFIRQHLVYKQELEKRRKLKWKKFRISRERRRAHKRKYRMTLFRQPGDPSVDTSTRGTSSVVEVPLITPASAPDIEELFLTPDSSVPSPNVAVLTSTNDTAPDIEELFSTPDSSVPSPNFAVLTSTNDTAPDTNVAVLTSTNDTAPDIEELFSTPDGLVPSQIIGSEASTTIETELSATAQDINILVDLLEEGEDGRPVVNISDRKTGRFVSKNVFIIGDKLLSEDEISVLSKGLGFCPTPSKINKYELEQDLGEFARTMRCRWFFRNSTQTEDTEYSKFRVKSDWEPPQTHLSPTMETYFRLVDRDILKIDEREQNFPNLTEGEREALQNLAQDRSVIIKSADKGSGVVVWDRSDYLSEAEKQLADSKTYQRVPHDLRTIVNLGQQSNRYFKKLFDKKLISKKVFEYFTFPVKNSAKLATIYFLPKIHKRLYSVPGRPVISNCGAATEKASEFLDHHLKPIMQASPTYIRDSSDFLEKIRELGPLPKEAILVTADVVGLYPSIPHTEGLIAIREALDRRVEPSIATNLLMELLEFVLTNNYFGFGSDMFRQIEGTAIGTKMAPPYACIFMDKFEFELLSSLPLSPLWWKRYIDDIIKIWTHGEKKLREFIRAVNSFHPTIRFTFEIARDTVDPKYFEDLEEVTLIPGKAIHYLDLNVWIENGHIQNDLYCKPTDCHQYLSFSSCHPYHVKRAIIYGQALRVKGICSSTENFETHMTNMKSWFIDRDYPGKLIDEQIARARSEDLSHRGRNKKSGPVLVATFHPALSKLSLILKEHFHLLQIDPEMQALFPEPPMVAYRNPKTLKNILVRAKLPLEGGRKGSFKCGGKRCQICKNVVEGDTFTSFVTGKSYRINFELNCNSGCINYLLSCKVCGKQLVGETTCIWRDRWKTYRADSKKAQKGEPHMQREVHAHFKLPGHTSIENDVDIMFIDKTDAVNPKIREKFWIDTLKTMSQHGLNVSETM